MIAVGDPVVMRRIGSRVGGRLDGARSRRWLPRWVPGRGTHDAVCRASRFGWWQVRSALVGVVV